MKVCGVSAHAHDSAAALVLDGRIVAAAHEERFSRRAGDPQLPFQALRACLERAGLQADALDALVFHEKPLRKFLRVLAAALANVPRGGPAFRGALQAWFERKLWVRADLARALGLPRERIVFGDHHLSHAAAPFLTHRLDSAAFLVAEAVGEWSSTTLGRLRRVPGGLAYEVLDTVDYPHSLGLLATVLSAYLGLPADEGGLGLAELAPRGTPRFDAALRTLVPEVEGGLFRLELRHFAHDRSATRGWTGALEELLGPPNPPHRPLEPGHLEPDELARFLDVAASFQRVLEERLIALARRAHERTGERVLCYGGALALNAAATGRLARSGPFERVLVHPASGDAGAALGAALSFAASRGERIEEDWTPFLGSEASVPAGLALPAGCELGPPLGPAELAEAVAVLLASDRLVGWCQGRAEWGPRALGARGILARPDSPGQVERLNRLVRNRAGCRPFAPLVLDELAEQVFEGTTPGHALERHGLAALSTRPEWRARLPAVTEVDGTARVQTLRDQDAPLLHDVLARFHARTALPVLAQAGLRLDGEPLANDARDAVQAFERGRLDALVLDSRLLVRPGGDAAQP